MTNHVVRYVDEVPGGNKSSSPLIASALSQTFNTIDEQLLLLMSISDYAIRQPETRKCPFPQPIIVFVALIMTHYTALRESTNL